MRSDRGRRNRSRKKWGTSCSPLSTSPRYLQIDPETALNQANRKFSARFRAMEKHFVSQGRVLKEVPLEEMEAFWQDNKQQTTDNRQQITDNRQQTEARGARYGESTWMMKNRNKAHLR